MPQFRLTFPRYPQYGSITTWAADEEAARQAVRADVVRDLGVWPNEVEVREEKAVTV